VVIEELEVVEEAAEQIQEQDQVLRVTMELQTQVVEQEDQDNVLK
jgi:hypothetical protein